MEDFEGAFLQRTKDVDALDAAGRRTAAMHLGGIAVECLLKYMITTTLPIKEWYNGTNNPGHTISRPGHHYQEALQCHNRLKSRIQNSPHVLKWLNEVENPYGHFIDIRYSGDEPDEEKYKRWLKSYRSLIGWLQKQATRV